jgi:hypothetical protein
MQRDGRTGLALIKHCAWLGTKMIFCVLGSVCLFAWLVIGSIFLDKLGVKSLRHHKARQALFVA